MHTAVNRARGSNSLWCRQAGTSPQGCEFTRLLYPLEFPWPKEHHSVMLEGECPGSPSAVLLPCSQTHCPRQAVGRMAWHLPSCWVLGVWWSTGTMEPFGAPVPNGHHQVHRSWVPAVMDSGKQPHGTPSVAEMEPAKQRKEPSRQPAAPFPSGFSKMRAVPAESRASSVCSSVLLCQPLSR